MSSASDAGRLLVVEEFLDGEACATLRAEIDRAPGVPATVARAGRDVLLDERERRTRGVIVPVAVRADVDRRLAPFVPRVAAHFGLDLDGVQTPQFLRYAKGDYFRPHVDDSSSPLLPTYIRARRASVVLFLDRQTRLPEDGSHCGGALRFFRMPGTAPDGDPRTEVWGRAGMLVAFPAATVHEVRPVTHGVRRSIVTWMTGPSCDHP